MPEPQAPSPPSRPIARRSPGSRLRLRKGAGLLGPTAARAFTLAAVGLVAALGTIARVAALATLAALAAGPAAAALIATGNGTGNVTAPSPDPGFARVGAVNGLSAVYARNGWVLTAGHVGEGELLLGGVRHAAVPGSTHRFLNDDGSPADLIAFKLATRPPLADVTLTATPAALNTLVTVIGYGFDRGSATTWMGVNGWNWAATRSMRWGTNRISQIGELVLGTQAFRITFDDLAGSPPGQYEADIVVGDSGGGAFVGSGTSAQLVGILFGRVSYVGQPASTSLYGNGGLIADLQVYRDQILAVTDRPDCNDGLDEDGDGLADFPQDPGCADAFDASEHGPAFQCDNGIDDDGDLAIDFPADEGCLYPTNPIEAPEAGLGAMLAAGTAVLAAHARRNNRRKPRTASAPVRRTNAGAGRDVVVQTSSTRSTR